MFKEVVVLFVLFISCFSNEFCSSVKDTNCTSTKSNKYSQEENTIFFNYLKQIEEAKLVYKPCQTEKCKCHLPVLVRDLKVFGSGISKEAIDNVKNKGTKYQIISHRLYRDKNCMFPARCSGIEHFLLQILPKLQDTEFIVNTRDWPQVHKKYGIFGPVFSFSKTNDYQDIMYPAWAFWEGGPAINLYPGGIGRWDNHRKILGKIGNETAWESKIGMGLFRGSRTSAERDPLVLLSREKPDIVDAQYTKNQAWKSEADTLHAPPAQEISFEEHCKYKYLFNFRGVAASFRFKHILLCKSLVFHVGNDWQEFFYAALKPWIHYIPVKADANKDDLENILRFAIQHDDIAKEIAESGYSMIWNHLKMKDVICYWRKLLQKYTSLLTFKPQLDENLIEIK